MIPFSSHLTDANYLNNLSEEVVNLASSIHKGLGSKHRRDLLVRKASEDSTEFNDILINPTPKIVLLAPTDDQILDPNYKIGLNTYKVTGMSNRYTASLLTKDIEFYIIDPIFNDTKTEIMGGTFCKPLLFIDKSVVYSKLMLTQINDTPDLPTPYYP